jgi:hypothetical protein
MRTDVLETVRLLDQEPHFVCGCTAHVSGAARTLHARSKSVIWLHVWVTKKSRRLRPRRVSQRVERSEHAPPEVTATHDLRERQRKAQHAARHGSATLPTPHARSERHRILEWTNSPMWYTEEVCAWPPSVLLLHHGQRGDTRRTRMRARGLTQAE